MSWPRVQLAEVAEIERNAISADQIGGGMMFVGLENIETGGQIIEVKPVSAGEIASTKFKFDSRHILYGKLRPYLAKIAAPSFEGICSTDILPILPGPKLCRSYLLHFLRQPSMVKFATSRSEGINLPRLSPRALAAFELPLPPLRHQERIAAILDAADTLRAKRRAALAKLGAVGQSIFFEMFGDPNINPKQLAKKRLGDVIRLKSGDFLPASQMANTGEYSVYGGNGMCGTHDHFMFSESKIVIGRVGAYCGCVHISPTHSWITDNALYVSEYASELEFGYLAFALKQANLNRFASQFGQPLVSGSRINPVEILVPNQTAQSLFCDRLEDVTRLGQKYEASGALLDALFLSLQQKAFQGGL